MELGNRVHRSVTRFVLPLGMTVHMNGSTLYMTMVPLFVAQMRNYPVGFAKTMALSLATICMIIAAPGSPSTGGAIIYYLSACKIIGVPDPYEVLALLMVFDWFMSRIRTAINVIGDCFVAAFVAKILGLSSESPNTSDEESGVERDAGDETEMKMLPYNNRNGNEQPSVELD